MNISRLIIKDIRLHGRTLFLILGVEISAIVIFRLQIPKEIHSVAFSLLEGMALIGGYLFCLRTMIDEEKNRAMLFVKTLPVSTMEIVTAKFGANLLLVSANVAVVLVYYGAARAFGFLSSEPSLTLHVVIITFALNWANNAFFVAIALIFELERAQWAPFLALFAILSLIVNLDRLETALHLRSAAAFLAFHWSVIVALLCGGVALLIWLSCWAMGRKQVFA
jgi:ABC-type transport system involved in multi-copper enzyme maturation permease subunit